MTNGSVCSVDYIAGSFPRSVPLSDITTMLGPGHWVALSRGARGYRRGLRLDHFRLFYDGRPEMGIHLQLPGCACRQLETCGALTSWPEFFGLLLDCKIRLCRIDIAFDDVNGGLNMGMIRQAVDEGRVVTRSRVIRVTEFKSPLNGAVLGEVVHFGSRQSDTIVRLYDKGKQSGGCKSALRAEIELHDGRAHACAQLIASENRLEVASSLLLAALDFKSTGRDSVRSRWKTCPWWTAFLGTATKKRLPISELTDPDDKRKRWLFIQVAPSLAQYYEDSGSRYQAIADLIAHGQRRLAARRDGRMSATATSNSSGLECD